VKYHIISWHDSERKEYDSLDDAYKAAFTEALEVLQTSPLDISGMCVAIMQGHEVVGDARVNRCRFDMPPRCSWSPAEYPSGELPHISPEEYAMILKHRNGDRT